MGDAQLDHTIRTNMPRAGKVVEIGADSFVKIGFEIEGQEPPALRNASPDRASALREKEPHVVVPKTAGDYEVDAFDAKGDAVALTIRVREPLSADPKPIDLDESVVLGYAVADRPIDAGKL